MSFKITILGSSGAMPAYGRFPSCQLVEIQNRYFLVDCGEGAQMQLMKYQANFHRIDHILISHLHGDHYLGLMGLIFTMHLQRRTNDIHIYGHRGLDEIMTMHMKHSKSVPSFKIHFHLLEKELKEVVYEDDKIFVETIPLHHKLRCSGFLFREKPKPRRIDKDRMPAGLSLQHIAALKRGDDVHDEHGNLLYNNHDYTHSPRKARSYAYCSDTAYHEPMLEQLTDVDLIYHEATFTEEDIAKAVETKHSTARQAATIAQKANAGKLLLGHFSARYKDLAPILDEARKVYLNCELAQEGMEFTIQE